MAPHKRQHHLFLLDRVEARLAHIVGGLPHLLVDLRTQRVGPPFLDTVGFDQSGFNQTFDHRSSGCFILLDTPGELNRVEAALLSQQGQGYQRIDGQGLARALLFHNDGSQQAMSAAAPESATLTVCDVVRL